MSDAEHPTRASEAFFGRRRARKIDLQRRQHGFEMLRLPLPKGLSLAAAEKGFGRAAAALCIGHVGLSS